MHRRGELPLQRFHHRLQLGLIVHFHQQRQRAENFALQQRILSQQILDLSLPQQGLRLPGAGGDAARQLLDTRVRRKRRHALTVVLKSRRIEQHLRRGARYRRAQRRLKAFQPGAAQRQNQPRTGTELAAAEGE
ncbi:Uncharacterised protein [Klebsiella pneumoniae]|nr:Uncharacterised protein [Klebsiella pneumoniae]